MEPDRLASSEVRQEGRSTRVVTAPIVGAGLAGSLRHSRFVVTAPLVSAFIGLPDGIIAIVAAVEQASDGLLPVRSLRRLGHGSSTCSKRQSDKYGCKVAHGHRPPCVEGKRCSGKGTLLQDKCLARGTVALELGRIRRGIEVRFSTRGATKPAAHRS